MTVAAVVAGRVTNLDDEAMVRAQVSALYRPSEEEIEDEERFTSRKQELQTAASSQTDDRGQYRIFGLKTGEYYIRVTDSFKPDGNVLPMRAIGFSNSWAANTLPCTTPV
jgi:hypothetical protein